MGYGTEIVGTICDNGGGWKDPRTGMCFINESVARSLGYGQPVNTPDTIVQVGSQGSYTSDGRLVTTEMLQDPNFIASANNSGYLNAARINLQQNPTSDAQSAYNGLVNYLHTGSYTDPNAAYVRPVPDIATTAQGNSGTGAPISPTVAHFAETDGVMPPAGAITGADTGADVTPGDGMFAKYGGMAIAAVIVIIGLLIIATRKTGVSA